MKQDLRAVCDGCGAAVGDEDGLLYVDHNEVRAVQEAHKAWHRPRDEEALTLEELLDHPGPACWQVRRTACLVTAEHAVYGIAVERVRTWRHLVGWTAHLMGKPWLPATDGDELLEQTAAHSTRRLVPVVPASGSLPP